MELTDYEREDTLASLREIGGRIARGEHEAALDAVKELIEALRAVRRQEDDRILDDADLMMRGGG